MVRYAKIKRRTHEILEVARPNDKANRIINVGLMCLILVNVAMIISYTFDLPPIAIRSSGIIETVSFFIFTIEYILRLWISDITYQKLTPLRARLRYIRSFAAIIDLVSLLPDYIIIFMDVNSKVMRILRVLLLFRAFKLNRYTNALHDIGEVFRKKANQLISSMLVVSFLMVISSVLIYEAEHEAQPEVFNNAFSGLWWAIATITTVGYGDIYPVTLIGRVMSAIIALLGIGLIAVPTGIITAGFSEQISQKRQAEEDEKEFCPYCGKKLKWIFLQSIAKQEKLL